MGRGSEKDRAREKGRVAVVYKNYRHFNGLRLERVLESFKGMLVR